MQSLILRTATRLLVSLMLVFSVYLLFRGHNAPGGGFAGALIAATGFALYVMAEGAGSVRKAIRIDPRRLIIFGMGLTLITGLIALFLDKPFLTGLWWSISEHPDATLAVGTPLLFDIGVFAIVLGTILTLILTLEEN
jgi:multisubunit Na+/H+ antiporter MnhB subunit